MVRLTEHPLGGTWCLFVSLMLMITLFTWSNFLIKFHPLILVSIDDSWLKQLLLWWLSIGGFFEHIRPSVLLFAFLLSKRNFLLVCLCVYYEYAYSHSVWNYKFTFYVSKHKYFFFWCPTYLNFDQREPIQAGPPFFWCNPLFFENYFTFLV